jgi:hypothetical protein
MLRGFAHHSSNRLRIDVFFEVPTLQAEIPFTSRSKVIPLSHFGLGLSHTGWQITCSTRRERLRGVASMTSAGSKTYSQPPKSTAMSAQRRVTPELSISGSHVLVMLGAGICLAGPLVWVFLKYWLFAP